MKIDCKRLRTARQKAGLTLADVSRILKERGFRAFSLPAIALWEVGENMPRADVLATLAEIYGMPVQDFFCSKSKVKNLT